MAQFDCELTGDYPAGVIVNVTDYNQAVRKIQQRDKLLEVVNGILVDDLIPLLPAEYVEKVRAIIAEIEATTL